MFLALYVIMNKQTNKKQGKYQYIPSQFDLEINYETGLVLATLSQNVPVLMSLTDFDIYEGACGLPEYRIPIEVIRRIMSNAICICKVRGQELTFLAHASRVHEV